MKQRQKIIAKVVGAGVLIILIVIATFAYGNHQRQKDNQTAKTNASANSASSQPKASTPSKPAASAPAQSATPATPSSGGTAGSVPTPPSGQQPDTGPGSITILASALLAILLAVRLRQVADRRKQSAT